SLLSPPSASGSGHHKRHKVDNGTAKISLVLFVQNFMEFYSEGQANSISRVMEIDDFRIQYPVSSIQYLQS
ncbi:MAG: hypothetical protein KJP05_05955, partial [Deltaproteobacteria bacterium]|nr:hypothetical protein [Deltaproteobacteria bacterium]